METKQPTVTTPSLSIVMTPRSTPNGGFRTFRALGMAVAALVVGLTAPAGAAADRQPGNTGARFTSAIASGARRLRRGG